MICISILIKLNPLGVVAHLHTHPFIHPFMQFWGYMGIPLVMSGDQVGMNGDEGGRGWGVRRFGERYSEKKGLSGKIVQK